MRGGSIAATLQPSMTGFSSDSPNGTVKPRRSPPPIPFPLALTIASFAVQTVKKASSASAAAVMNASSSAGKYRRARASESLSRAAALDVDAHGRSLRKGESDEIPGVAGVEFDLTMKKSRLAEFLFDEHQFARIGIEVAAEQSPRGRACHDRAAAIVGEVITVRARPLRFRERLSECFDDITRNGHIDEADISITFTPSSRTMPPRS